MSDFAGNTLFPKPFTAKKKKNLRHFSPTVRLVVENFTTPPSRDWGIHICLVQVQALFRGVQGLRFNFEKLHKFILILFTWAFVTCVNTRFFFKLTW